MASERASGLTREDVLKHIRALWHNDLGDDQPIKEEESFIARLAQIDPTDELDFADLAYRLERNVTYHDLSFRVFWRTAKEPYDQFLRRRGRGLDFSEWRARVAPTLTFGAWAEFVAQRNRVEELRPTFVLGRSCRPAGAFRATERVAREVCPRVAPFAPSTRIRAPLRGPRLREFWNRLRWQNGDTLPPLRRTTRNYVADAALSPVAHLVLLLIGLLTFTGTGATLALNPGPAFGLGVLAVVLLATGMFALDRLWGYLENPLPAGYRTFRDLALGLAASSTARDSAPQSRS